MGADSAITLDGQSRVAIGVTTYVLPRRAKPGAQTKPRRCERRGPSERRRYARNNGAPVEFELARFCVPPFGSARVAYSPPRPRAGGFVHWRHAGPPDFGDRIRRMIRIAISQAAFDAIARTMPFGSVNFEAGVDERGERYIWLPQRVIDRPSV